MAEHRYVVVDGSNLATEGRTEPSLHQLDEAVRAYAEEDPEAEIVVVVDASFAHRIKAEERPELEQAVLHGELVSPPAGAVGRGDAFVLRIAERTGAKVLSNDSFQEFHEEHPWLFQPGRLVGGKPVPGVGWIFTPRNPVRAPKPTRTGRGPKLKPAPGEPKPAIGATRQPLSAAPPADGAAPTPAKKATRAKKAAAKALVEEVVAEATPKKATKKGAKAATPAKKATRAKKAATKALVEEVVAEATPKKATKKGAKAPTPAKKATRAKKAAKATEALSASDEALPDSEAPVVAKAAVKKRARAKTQSGDAVASVAKRVRQKAASAEAPVSGEPAGAEGLRPHTVSLADGDVRSAVEAATAEAFSAPEAEVEVERSGARRRRRRRNDAPSAVNESLPFITFVADHPLGSQVEGEVVSFTSHGAMVDVTVPDGHVLRCYVPLSGLGDPPPRRARDVVNRGERRRFVLVGLDPARRAAELALPDIVQPAAGAQSATSG